MLLLRRISVPILILFYSPLFAQPQGPIAPPPASAEILRASQNSPDGLRLQLQDILDVARQGNASGLQSLIKQMEIPNSSDWFVKAYGSERAASYSPSYENDLQRNGSNFEALLRQLTSQDGNFLVRKVNDAPAPGMEERMLDGLQGGTPVYFASWKRRASSPDARGNSVGYFVFVDGSFRLIRAFDLLPNRPLMGSASGAPRGTWSTVPGNSADNVPGSAPSNGPVQPRIRFSSYPTCVYCPDPGYSEAARKKHLQGSVVLQMTVQPDGSATDIQVLKSPDPELSQLAMDAVSRWRLKPALNADGDAVAYREPVEVTFRLTN
jgi:TonB family protein